MVALLARLIRSVIDTEVRLIDGNLDRFERDKNPHRFSLEFSKEFLSSFIKDIKENTYYELIDNLNQRLFIFKFEGAVFFVGPYLKRFLSETEITKIGAQNLIPFSLLESLKMQYFDLPVRDSYHIEQTLNSLINAIDAKNEHAYVYQKVDHFKDNKERITKRQFQEGDLAERAIYEKYEIENNLLYQVEHGRVEEIKLGLENISSVFQEDYLTKFYTANPQAAMASYRTLLRKSAEKSGLPVPIIDRIISKHTQIMLASSPNEQFKCLGALALELTSEVRDYLVNTKCESPLIKDVCEYLFIHYNQAINLEKLTVKFSVSKFYLSHLFKKETGKSIGAYLEDIRMLRAKELLHDNAFSISEVASLVGFPDNNYFTKAFKKKTGLTPSKYRLNASK